jgi:glycerol-1-phosphate dehydrogenase [NAD(P)+]
VIVQTAASVNGFADDQSVLLLDGVKHTTATRWPERLLIDSDVIARAPVELNRAGFGDLLATYTAPADWRLAQLVGQDDSYSPFVVELARAHVDTVLDRADGIHRADAEAIEHLSAALALSGIAMGIAGRTAPGSGMEHTVSHLLEMAEQSGADAQLHGAKVGALSVLAAMLWARVRTVARSGGLRALRFPSREQMEPRVRAAFAELDPSGRVGETCWQDYARKLDRWNDSREELEALWHRWPAFDAELDRLLASPERLVEALRAARAPVRLAQLGVRDRTARWALAHGHLMRDRFSVADLAFFMGIWDSADVDGLLVCAARLGAGL